MTRNEDSQAQAALWDVPQEDRLLRTGPRSTKRSEGPATPAETGDLWSIDRVAAYLGVPKQTIYCWRTTGYGPQGFRVGKHLRWRAATVFARTAELERRQ